jgi:catechol 2,3-dioxygenase-like lactoylglutathione lyase family enzyme
MDILDFYSIVVTPHVAECRDFYVNVLEFDIVFEASWFVYLRHPASPAAVAFMARDHPSTPPGPEAFSGKGAFLTLQVEDAAAEYQRLSDRGATFAYPLKDEPWGQRRFALVDPAGMWLDIVEHIEPAPGYWETHS